MATLPRDIGPRAPEPDRRGNGKPIPDTSGSKPETGRSLRLRRGGRVKDPIPGDNRFPTRRLKGRYQLGAVLGQGSLGTTYRAEDVLLQRSVAVKMLADRYADDTIFRERFMAATAAAGRLIHPNIVTVLDAGVADGHPFVVMELVEGQSLRARLNDRGPLQIPECQRLALQMAEALIVAHRHRVIHGDIRPENVLLDEHGNAKLTDFGFVRAAVTSDVTLLGQVQRAPYSPPELAIRDRGDEPTDVYGLAVVIYEMLTGITPRATAGNDRMAQVAPTAVRRRRPDVPAHLDRALWKALEPDPRERIGTAAELRVALMGREMLAAVAAPAATMPAAAWRSEPRQRQRTGPDTGSIITTMIPLIATLALVAAAIGGTVFFIPRLFDGWRATDVPSLTGRPLPEAIGVAESNGLTLKTGESIVTDDQPKGTILSQDPPPDRRVRRGTEVKVITSAGIRPPNVLGRPLDEARTILVKAGWTVSNVEVRAEAQGPSGVVVGMKPSPQEPADDRRQGITLFMAAGNLATGRPVKLEAGGQLINEMTDGKLETVGYLGKASPTWVEVELEQPIALTGVELIVAQETPAVTIHEVWVWTTDGQYRGMHTFVGPTADAQTLSVRFDAPVANVRAVRIATTQAIGRVGWREIRLFDR